MARFFAEDRWEKKGQGRVWERRYRGQRHDLGIYRCSEISSMSGSWTNFPSGKERKGITVAFSPDLPVRALLVYFILLFLRSALLLAILLSNCRLAFSRSF
jgi:hypothetical protein